MAASGANNSNGWTTPKSAHAKGAAATKPQKAPLRPPKQVSITCPLCTLVNPAHLSYCDACENPLPLLGSTTTTTISVSSTTAVQPSGMDASGIAKTANPATTGATGTKTELGVRSGYDSQPATGGAKKKAGSTDGWKPVKKRNAAKIKTGGEITRITESHPTGGTEFYANFLKTTGVSSQGSTPHHPSADVSRDWDPVILSAPTANAPIPREEVPLPPVENNRNDHTVRSDPSKTQSTPLPGLDDESSDQSPKSPAIWGSASLVKKNASASILPTRKTSKVHQQELLDALRDIVAKAPPPITTPVVGSWASRSSLMKSPQKTSTATTKAVKKPSHQDFPSDLGEADTSVHTVPSIWGQRDREERTATPAQLERPSCNVSTVQASAHQSMTTQSQSMPEPPIIIAEPYNPISYASVSSRPNSVPEPVAIDSVIESTSEPEEGHDVYNEHYEGHESSMEEESKEEAHQHSMIPDIAPSMPPPMREEFSGLPPPLPPPEAPSLPAFPSDHVSHSSSRASEQASAYTFVRGRKVMGTTPKAMLQQQPQRPVDLKKWNLGAEELFKREKRPVRASDAPPKTNPPLVPPPIEPHPVYPTTEHDMMNAMNGPSPSIRPSQEAHMQQMQHQHQHHTSFDHAHVHHPPVDPFLAGPPHLITDIRQGCFMASQVINHYRVCIFKTSNPEMAQAIYYAFSEHLGFSFDITDAHSHPLKRICLIADNESEVWKNYERIACEPTTTGLEIGVIELDHAEQIPLQVLKAYPYTPSPRRVLITSQALSLFLTCITSTGHDGPPRHQPPAPPQRLPPGVPPPYPTPTPPEEFMHTAHHPNPGMSYPSNVLPRQNSSGPPPPFSPMITPMYYSTTQDSRGSQYPPTMISAPGPTSDGPSGYMRSSSSNYRVGGPQGQETAYHGSQDHRPS